METKQNETRKRSLPPIKVARCWFPALWSKDDGEASYGIQFFEAEGAGWRYFRIWRNDFRTWYEDNTCLRRGWYFEEITDCGAKWVPLGGPFKRLCDAQRASYSYFASQYVVENTEELTARGAL